LCGLRIEMDFGTQAMKNNPMTRVEYLIYDEAPLYKLKQHVESGDEINGITLVAAVMYNRADFLRYAQDKYKVNHWTALMELIDRFDSWGKKANVNTQRVVLEWILKLSGGSKLSSELRLMKCYKEKIDPSLVLEYF